MSSYRFSTKAGIQAGFAAGLWDLIAAILIYSVIGSLNVITLLQFIASGALGNSVFSGGYATAAAGLFFHFLIAFIFAFIYVVLYTQLSFLRKNQFASGLLYGKIVWIAMNYIVVPLSQAPRGPIAWNVATWMNIAAHLGIGLIIAIITHRHYSSSRT